MIESKILVKIACRRGRWKILLQKGIDPIVYLEVRRCVRYSGISSFKGGKDKLSFFVSRYVIPALSGREMWKILSRALMENSRRP